MRLSIREGWYRGRKGFKVFGSDKLGRRIRVFAESRTAAERIRDKVRKGEAINTEDFKP